MNKKISPQKAREILEERLDRFIAELNELTPVCRNFNHTKARCPFWVGFCTKDTVRDLLVLAKRVRCRKREEPQYG